jgi:hypothetical protein
MPLGLTKDHIEFFLIYTHDMDNQDEWIIMVFAYRYIIEGIHEGRHSKYLNDKIANK